MAKLNIINRLRYNICPFCKNCPNHCEKMSSFDPSSVEIAKWEGSADLVRGGLEGETQIGDVDVSGSIEGASESTPVPADRLRLTVSRVRSAFLLASTALPKLLFLMPALKEQHP